tara:strand:- start:272 stop:1063 length:792 start_codon:yes stop_codon:yes gene_type:complete
MKKSIKVKHAFIIIILSILTAFLSGGLVLWLSMSFSETHQKLFTFVSFIVGQGFMVIPLMIYLQYNNFSILKSIRLKPIKYDIIIYTILLSFGIIILSDELDRIIQIFIPAPEYVTNLNDLLKPETLYGTILLFIAVSILAPLGEEIIFRGFLQRVLEKHWNDITKSVLFTALLFSMIHMNPYWFVQIYILGIVLGFLAWKTQSIISPLILHGLNNSAAMVLSFSDPSNSIYLWKNHVAPWFLIFAVTGVIIGFKGINNSFRK